MAMCEKCWGDAFLETLAGFHDQSYYYQKLLLERKDSPCTPREQAGQFWDEEKQKDRRIKDEKEKI